MACAPEFYVTPGGGGRLTAEALLRSEGSVELMWGVKEFPKEKHCVFHIAGDGFWFGFGFIDQQLVLQRMGYEIRISETYFNSLPGNNTVIASWTMTQLTLLLGHVGFVGPSHRKFVVTEPTLPPPSLLKWARQQSLLPVVEYESEEDFVSRVHSGLSLLQDKINEMSNRSIFWDIGYERGSITGRSPKREMDILPILQGLLSDQFFLASIEVYPELTTGAGRLDFLFVASIKGHGLAKVCAEFKLINSGHLESGIEHQLPEYMRSQRTVNGTYCILDFGENHRSEDRNLHERLAAAARRGWPDRLHPIKVHHLYLGDRRAPSVPPSG